jgi:preprotein translocase subunit Sec61beta
MADRDKNRGFHSAAGLIQYYDMEETKALKIPPAIVVGCGIAVGVLIKILQWRYPT